jgi:hypothetical protein
MIRQNVCILAIFAAITVCTSSARAATQFDGPWKMRFITLTGPCNPFYNVKGQIIDGSIQYGGVSGRVTPSGVLSATVTFGSTRGSGAGRLSKASGSGIWRAQLPNGPCNGTWSAERD